MYCCWSALRSYGAFATWITSFATHQVDANAYPNSIRLRIRVSTTHTSMLSGYVTLHPLSYFYFDPVDKSRTLSSVPPLPASDTGVTFAAHNRLSKFGTPHWLRPSGRGHDVTVPKAILTNRLVVAAIFCPVAWLTSFLSGEIVERLSNTEISEMYATSTLKLVSQDNSFPMHTLIDRLRFKFYSHNFYALYQTHAVMLSTNQVLAELIEDVGQSTRYLLSLFASRVSFG